MRRLPVCIGEYERGDSQCDGARPKTPCVFRDRCVALCLHASKLGARVSRLVRLDKVRGRTYAYAKDPELHGRLDAIIVSHGIKDGQVAGRRKRPRRQRRRLATASAAQAPRTAEAKLAAAQGATQAAAASRIATWELFTWLTHRLRKETGRSFEADRAAAEPGDFYIVDRQGYSVICCRLDRGRRLVCAVYLRPRKLALEVRVAADYEPFVELCPNEHAIAEDMDGRDGNFNVRFRRLLRAGLSELASVVAKAIDNHLIELPPPS